MAKKYRILHVLPKFSPGGAERVMVHLLRNLDKDYFETGAVSLFAPMNTELEDMISGIGIPIYYLDKKLGFDLTMYKKIGHVLQEFRPDVVNTHQHVLKYLLPALVLKKVPVVVHTVHSLAEHEVNGFDRFVQFISFKMGVFPVAVSREVGISLTRVYGIKKFAIIPNGIPVEQYTSSNIVRQDWRKENQFKNEDILFICVAGLREVKNHKLLLNAFAVGPARSPQAHLLLVGDGDQKLKLQALCSKLNLQNKVHFLGFRTDIPNILSMTDIFVLSSDWEGNPLSVMEAMASGKPIISTSVGGIPELVDDGEQGFLVPANNVQALANAMFSLLEDSQRRLNMGLSGMKKAKEKFDIKVMANAYSELYKVLLRSKIDKSCSRVN